MKLLDENGFVFLDDNSKPFHVRMYGDTPWLFYWHPDGNWVTLRPVTQTEVWQMAEKKLPKEQADLYMETQDVQSK